ncbi:snRNA-activating protein complex subunit 1-like [Embiotoca jacksoni]|uniref:snRNA-activating protein complex subunit 1-like n=1 Tax=Embiotoca jacksoni TaxID=100190 RepID=UPI00370449AA
MSRGQSRHRVPLYSDFFYQPLTEDVQELLARFQRADSVRYEVFSAIWREMSFPDVFRGTGHTCELKRFCRVAMATALKYFLPPHSYQIRVGGLYLMFAFYHAQLAAPPVKIRVALRDWVHVRAFLADTADSGHHDAAYVYQKLAEAKAFHFTAMPHLLSFQKRRRPREGSVRAEFLGGATSVRELACGDLLEEVANIQGHYEKMKEATKEVSSQVDAIHRDFASRLRNCMSEFLTWQQETFPSKVNKDKTAGDGGGDEEEEMEEEQESCSRRAALLSSIKRKSYGRFQEASGSRRTRRAEAVDASSWGEGLRKKRPSLRARTWESLGVPKEDDLQVWILSAPESQGRGTARWTNQA